MSLSAVEIAQIVAELAPRLRGGATGKVYLRDDELLLELGRERLLISTHPRASRLHLDAGQAERSGAAPPAFAMLLRKRLGGMRLHDLRVEPGERVLTLDFGAGKDKLIAELSGPHANVFLVDAEGLVVASRARSQSTTRLLAVGAPYTPPAPGPATAKWRSEQRFGDAPGVAERVAQHYHDKLRATEEQQLRERATSALRKEIARVERREHALLGDLSRVAEAATMRKHADLLLAHTSTLPGRGATSATVPDDFEDGSPLTITLDPAQDVRQNAARLYRQHKRFTEGRKHSEARLAVARVEKAALVKRVAALDALDLAALRTLVPPPKQVARRAAPEERLPYRECLSVDGQAIWIGRSATDNDALTFRHARGGDVWLHSRDAPGSHVVVPQRSGAVASEATIQDAAVLAGHHSNLRDEEQVDVMVTLVKNVRKAGAPGRVYTSDTRTVRVRLEPARISRLHATSPR